MSKRLERFFIVDDSDCCESFFYADDAYLVPYSTLDDERKSSIEDGEYSKLFKHGGDFPAIPMSDILDYLEETGQLAIILKNCQEKAQSIRAPEEE